MNLKLEGFLGLYSVGLFLNGVAVKTTNILLEWGNMSFLSTETFNFIDKKSIKVENGTDLSWSPTNPIFALFVPELGGGNRPARVSLFQIPDKQELRQKNLFNVSDCKMHWQSTGSILLLRLIDTQKPRKTHILALSFFRIREGEIPIEGFQLDNKNEKVISFAWEPKGVSLQLFTVILSRGPMLVATL